MKPRIYLAGPITGLTYGEAKHGWRAQFANMVEDWADVLSPMRGKNFLENIPGTLRGDPKMYQEAVATAKGILMRDYRDVSTCDAMVACFLGATKVSIGTCCEFGFAHALRKPVVLVMEKSSNPHEHAFLDAIAGYCVDNLEDAAFLARAMLMPGV